MKCFLLLLCFLLCSCATEQPRFAKDMPAAPAPVYISSIGDVFPVQGIFEGTVQVKPHHVEVTFPSAEIRVERYNASTAPRHISAVQVGLGRPLSDERWDGLNWTTLAILDRTLQTGDRMTFSPPRSVQIPVGSSMDLNKMWIIVRIENVVDDGTKQQERVGYCYAHSSRDVFAAMKSR